MKISIDIDMTPEELRKVMGMPDVQQLQQEMMDKIVQKMEEGVEGYDPLTLFKPYMSSGAGSMESLQKIMMGLMSSSLNSSKETKS